MEALQSKTKKIKRLLIISAIVIALLVSAFLVLYRCAVVQQKASDLSERIALFGWEDYIKYSMLSDKLKEIVSEEEFNDSSPEVRMAMYRKLEGLLIDDKPVSSFDGSTGFWKAPYFEIHKEEGISYMVTFRIDLDAKLDGSVEVVNFACYYYRT